MLIFALAPIFANMQGNLFTSDIRMLGIDAMTLMGSAYCIGAGAIFAFTSVKNMVFVARASVVLTLASFIPWMLMQDSQFTLSMAILFTFGLGGCAACTAFAYTFALNNTERFFGAAIISLFCMLMELDYGISFISGLFDKTYLTILVLGSAICLWQYKEEEFTDALKHPDAKLNPAIKLMLYFFVAHKLVEIFYTYFPVASTPDALVTNGVVGVLVIGLCFALQVLAKRSIWNMCNLFFIAMICTYALFFAPADSVGREFSHYFHGFEQMGYIASYYLLGCVFKKHGNFRLFKQSLIIILPGCLLLYIIPGALSAFVPELMTFFATLITGIVFAVFFLMSPAYSKHLFFADWSDDFYHIDMTTESTNQLKKTNRLENIKLTPRENEIAILLLQGNETKQISQELDIKYDTVKYHIKRIYKKSGVGSRTELFMRFGIGSDITKRSDFGESKIPETNDLIDFPAEQNRKNAQTGQEDYEPSAITLLKNEYLQRLDTLTTAEREILDMYLCGLTPKQIADSRVTSLSTVRFHSRNIYAKLGVASRKELMLIARIVQSK